MTKREIILISLIFLVLAGFAMLWFWKPSEIPSSISSKTTPTVPKPSSTSAVGNSWPVIIPMPEYPQLSLKAMSVDEATKISVARLMKDNSADWKVRLNFYGKVVDENNQPVAGAKVHYNWNVVGGNNETDTLSDGYGLFSLIGKHGKFLAVHVEKEGYYTDNGGRGDPGFEFADPSDPNWYEPDARNPAIFHLRKKGEGAKLFSKSLDVPLSNAHPVARVNLMMGLIKPDGVLTLTCDTTRALPGAQPYPWTFGISLSEGGLVETKEQFPFLAPTSGYVPSITFQDDNLDRSIWRGGVKTTYYFYLPSTNTYGRVNVEKVASLSVATLDIFYNLTPGNRVLETAPKQ